MLRILNVKVYDLYESVIASGNAMRLNPVEYTEEEFQKGLARMVRLVNTSQQGNVRCHDNALTGIRVSFDLVYPQYWSPEFQRYHFADIVTSSSKMHRLCKMDIKQACNKYVDERLIAVEQEKVDKYNADPTYENFMEMVSNCPLGLELFMRVSTNYKQLQTIYYQRRHHKLKEDWGAFCEMIENLPYFHELILGENKNTNTNPITRSDIINRLIEVNNYKSYLEIGMDLPQENFLKINCENKESCDPYLGTENVKEVDDLIRSCLTYHMTSDEMFAQIDPEKKWDIVFIDGLHTKEQVAKDIVNSMKHLNKNGVIVVHDCLPRREECQIVPRICGEWNGDVWKAVAHMNESGIKLHVLDTDWGVGIIPYQELKSVENLYDNNHYEWKDFEEHRNELLNVIPKQDILRFIENAQK